MRLQALIVSLGIAFSLALPAAAAADVVKLREDAPDRHVVVKGDTLWDISAKFLKSPWLWPELWRANDDHIKNPHLIYPGDVVYLVMTPEGPRLATLETVKLSPTVREEPIARGDAIQAIPYDAVKALLSRPMLAEAGVLAKAPRLIASVEGRNLAGLGDRVLADAIADDTAAWHIVRVGKPVVDPATGQTLAHEILYVGPATVRAKGSPATLEIGAADREVQVGDYLIPAESAKLPDFMPHPPAKAVSGQIVSIVGNTHVTSRHATVVLNKGKADGLEPGHVLAVSHPGGNLGLKKAFTPKDGFLEGKNERGNSAALVEFNNSGIQKAPDSPTPLPDVRTGLVMVYKVFDRVAYALVMEATGPLYLLDRVDNP